MNNEMNNKKTALLVSALASFLTPFMISSVNIALPLIGNEFKINAVILSWIGLAYLLAAAMFLIPIGRIADIYGRKKIFTYGVIIYTLSSILCAISNSSGFLIFSRFLQGTGGAMIFGTAVAILTSVFPAGERGKAIGINVSSVYLGLSLGPFLGGVLTQHFGWRSVFIVSVPIGLIIIILIFLNLKGEWAEAKGEKFDFAGSAIYAFSLLSLIYGFSRLPDTNGLCLVLIGLLFVVLFIKWEINVENPVININLFKANKMFTFSNFAALIQYISTFGVTFLLSLYLQYIKGLNPQTAGLLLVSQPAIMVMFSSYAGKLSDRIEPKTLATIGMVITFTGLFLFIFLTEKTSTGFIVSNLIILGLGFALFSSPNTNAVMSCVERKFYGVASATLGTMRITGQMFSMGIVMIMLAVYMGKTQIIPEYYPLFLKSIKTTFSVFSILCFIGIIISLKRGNLR